MHSVDEDLPLEISVNSLKIIKVDEYELPEFSSNYSPSLASKFLSTLLLFKMVRPELAIQPLTSTQTAYLRSNYPRRWTESQVASFMNYNRRLCNGDESVMDFHSIPLGYDTFVHTMRIENMQGWRHSRFFEMANLFCGPRYLDYDIGRYSTSVRVAREQRQASQAASGSNFQLFHFASPEQNNQE